MHVGSVDRHENTGGLKHELIKKTTDFSPASFSFNFFRRR